MTSINQFKLTRSSHQMAERVVDACRNKSAAEFVALFPLISDFKTMMKESAEIYGSYLAEAQAEFASRYESKLIPAVRASFETLIAEGKDQGIDWSAVHYEGSEVAVHPTGKFSSAPVTIIVTSKGIEHRIIIHNALVIDGNWKVSQFIKLSGHA